jgi:ATPase, P-type (transporting), HAD superfamily, subfamily IC
MGITGTEVTKEASDMILLDDNFATIVKAIELGRWIYDNIKKYLVYLLSCNLIEIIVLSVGALISTYIFKEFSLPCSQPTCSISTWRQTASRPLLSGSHPPSRI